MSAHRNSGVGPGPAAAVGSVVALALVAASLDLAGRTGLELAYLNGAVAGLWPPAGVGLAILFLYGIRLWPGIVVGDLLLADYPTPFGTVAAPTPGTNPR